MQLLVEKTAADVRAGDGRARARAGRHAREHVRTAAAGAVAQAHRVRGNGGGWIIATNRAWSGAADALVTPQTARAMLIKVTGGLGTRRRDAQARRRAELQPWRAFDVPREIVAIGVPGQKLAGYARSYALEGVPLEIVVTLEGDK